MPSLHYTRFNRQERYTKVEQLTTNIKEAQGIQNLVQAYPEALDKLPKYTKDTEKTDKDGHVIRKAGSYRDNLTKTFEESLATYTKKSLDSLTLDGDYRSIYIPVQQALSTLPNQQYLTDWKDQYAAKILSLAKEKVELPSTESFFLSVRSALSVTNNRMHRVQWRNQYAQQVLSLAEDRIKEVDDKKAFYWQVKQVLSFSNLHKYQTEWDNQYSEGIRALGKAQLELQTTLSDMENTTTHASVSNDLCEMENYFDEFKKWDVDYATKVITLLAASLKTLTESEDIYQTAKRAKAIISYIPSYRVPSLDNNPCPGLIWIKTPMNSLNVINYIAGSEIRNNTVRKMREAPTPELLSSYAKEVRKEPYNKLLTEHMHEYVQHKHFNILCAMAEQKIFHASSIDEVEVMFDLYHNHLLNNDAIHRIIMPNLTRPSPHSILIEDKISSARDELVTQKTFKCLLLDMDVITNEDQLNKVVDNFIKLFPDKKHPLSHKSGIELKKEMQIYFISKYCDKLYELADKKIATTNSSEALKVYYGRINNLLQSDTLSQRFYPQTDRLPHEARDYSMKILNALKNNYDNKLQTPNIPRSRFFPW